MESPPSIQSYSKLFTWDLQGLASHMGTQSILALDDYVHYVTHMSQLPLVEPSTLVSQPQHLDGDLCIRSSTWVTHVSCDLYTFLLWQAPLNVTERVVCCPVLYSNPLC